MTPTDDIRARQTASHRRLARKQAEADAAAADAPAHATDDHPHDAADDDADHNAPGAPPSNALLKFRAEIDKAELRGAAILAELRHQMHVTAVRFDHIAQVARNGASILSDLADACDMPIQHEPSPVRTRYGMEQNRANEKAAQAVAHSAAADTAEDADEP